LGGFVCHSGVILPDDCFMDGEDSVIGFEREGLRWK
jgi:hypothetical protein